VISVLLVDDQSAVRQGLRMRLALEPDITIVGEADEGVAAVHLASLRHPDVIVLDLEMSGMDGLHAIEALRAVVPDTAIVVLSMHDNAVSRRQVLTAGANLFVGKHEGSERLPSSIREAAHLPKLT
jgi:two-component system, NarL family, response regulator NreC